MAEWHISEELLEQFLREEASKQEVRRVVRHLLSGCPQCSEMAYRVTTQSGLFTSLGTSGKAGWEQSYEEIFDRALASVSEEEQRLAREKLRGWAQWAQLKPMSPQARFVLVESDPRFHIFGLYDCLLEVSRWYCRREPVEAVDVVRLAILVAERLDPALVGDKLVADLQAAAWGALGNAKRIASDFEGARRAFNEAWRILENGTGDPAEEARLLSLEASYIKDIGEFETAESALEEAFQLYRKAGDTHGQGRILFQMGDVIGYVDPERGIAHIKKALALVDPSREPWLKMYMQHDLALFLTENGQPEEALAILEHARPLFKEFWDDLTHLRLHWMKARSPTGSGSTRPRASSGSSGTNSALGTSTRRWCWSRSIWRRCSLRKKSPSGRRSSRRSATRSWRIGGCTRTPSPHGSSSKAPSLAGRRWRTFLSASGSTTAVTGLRPPPSRPEEARPPRRMKDSA